MNITQNVTNITGNACTISAYYSIYVDPNVPSSEYWKCPESWIGNGLCDDSCRTEECSWDNGDCDEDNMCIDGSMCATVYTFWNIFFKPETYTVNHTYVCNEVWPVAVSYFGVDPGNCTARLQQYDYNSDLHMNFREFVVFGLDCINPGQSVYSQVNIYQCIGVQNYNL